MSDPIEPTNEGWEFYGLVDKSLQHGALASMEEICGPLLMCKERIVSVCNRSNQLGTQ